MTPRDLFDTPDSDDRSLDPPSINSPTCELDLILHYDNTARGAILVSRSGIEAQAVWLPKSQIEYTRTADPKAGLLPAFKVKLPEWLAKDRGLI